MKVTAYGSVVFFVCLNLSLYLLNETQVLPSYQLSPYEEPAGITAALIDFNITADELLLAGIPLAVAGIIFFVTGNFIFGGTVAIILFALQLLFPIVRWILFGFPIFLGQIGVPVTIVYVIEALLAVVWSWFMIGFIGQRSSWEQ